MRKLFLTSFPHGKLRTVEVLGPNKNIRGGIHIRYIDGPKAGRTDTTTNEFLFDIPEELEASDPCTTH